MSRYSSFESAVIHGGIDGDALTGAVNVPIYQTSTYAQEVPGVFNGYEYSRTGNPTRKALEELIAELEGGVAGYAFGSGMAALTAVLSLLSSGDEVIIGTNVYGGTFRVLDKVFKRFGVGYRMADTARIEAVEEAVTPKTAAILIETPANPLLTITDLPAVAELARSLGILSICDSTFMTPYLQRPLELGFDLVVHSATKYLGGHSDLVAGLVATASHDLSRRLHSLQNATGGVLGPFDSFLLIRGIKTLAVRMERHVDNALKAAGFLREHPYVKKVYFPGFEDFEGHDVHARQASGPGAMISFELAEGADTNAFFRALNLVTLAESLGGVESLVCHPATMTHAAIPRPLRLESGITDELIRLSTGIEAADDIIADLDQAIRAAVEG